jgi:hypothetical protein
VGTLRQLLAIYALFGLNGAPLSLAIFDKRLALLLAPVVTAVALGMGASAAPLLGSSPATGQIVCAIAIVVIGLGWLLKHQGFRECKGSFRGLFAAWPALLLLVGVRQGAYAWDFRSIWYLRSKSIPFPEPQLSSFLKLKALSFAHLDYPLLPSSAMAWSNRWLPFGRVENAQATIGLLTCLSLAALGLRFHALLEERHGISLPVDVVSLALSLTTVLILGPVAITGYVDGLWAVLVVLGLTFAWEAPNSVSQVMILLTGAALTKNEGLAVALICVGAVWFLQRERKWILALLWFAPAFCWVAYGRRQGLIGDYSPAQLVYAITHTADSAHRIWFAIESMMRQLVVVLLFVTGFLVLSRSDYLTFARIRSHNPRVWLTGVIGGIVLGLLLGSYMISAFEIHWHLRTSISRTSIIIKLLMILLVLSIVTSQHNSIKFSRAGLFVITAVPLTLFVGLLYGQGWSVVKSTQAASAQMSCVEADLLKSVPPNRSLVVVAKDSFWSQRLNEFAVGKREFGNESDMSSIKVNIAEGGPCGYLITTK